jgi:hypothetical protein
MSLARRPSASPGPHLIVVWTTATRHHRRAPSREPTPMPQPRRRPAPLFVAAMLSVAIAAALWNGLIPHRFLPLPTLNIAEPGSWFLDFRIAALKSDVAQCQATLTSPLINARAMTDAPYDKGCGWRNAVRVSTAGGASVSIDKMSCDLAAAFAMWMAHEVQPAARQYLNSDVKSVQHMGVYACRNIVGSAALTAFRSQHARANAIDVASFNLADGRSISVARHWKGLTKDGAKDPDNSAKFLHAIHRAACRYFRVALGPNYNAAHSNHFHLDRGAFKSCR